ncbi:MAG: lipoate--protein ligase family protein [Planctomycetia bacterium]|nr:lipoate--protein ligase family protein [Planctomycetia bacterium]
MPRTAEIDRRAPCRLIVDPPAAGAWQMAVDEALLESAAANGGCTLRFYGWSEPTLSLGYFQDYAQRETHHASRRCAVVRRQTGGGAILHDRELTYSLTISVAHPLAQDASRLYNAVHRALVGTLNRFGVSAYLSAAATQSTTPEQPFLCFQRRAGGDVLVGDSKIGGSAQRRRRGAILQHGSLLWARSPQAPELPGIEELAGKRLNHAEFIADCQQQLGTGLRLDFEPRGLTATEQQLVRSLAVEKYDTAGWNRRR